MEGEGLTINEMIHAYCRNDFELELDGLISREYPHKESMELGTGIANLVYEICEHRKGKKKAISKLEDKVQIVELLSSGSSLTEEELSMINERYEQGAKAEYEPYRNGTKIAAYFLSKFNGTVCIENCSEGDYTVKNIVRLPV
jgi:hypothetical protein